MARLPISELNKTACFSNRYFHRDNFTKLRKRLPEVFLIDIRIKPSNKYLQWVRVRSHIELKILEAEREEWDSQLCYWARHQTENLGQWHHLHVHHLQPIPMLIKGGKVYLLQNTA